MNEALHRQATDWAAELANRFRPAAFPAGRRAWLAAGSGGADWRRDLEFVNVHWAPDDPHARDFPAVNDRAHFSTGGFSHSALTHFIDIRKGPGLFDDYDGYAYARGSAHVEEYQKAEEAVSGWGRWLAEVLGSTVDAGMNFWLRDEYAHAPGQPWYRRCSPALERYSFPEDLGVYAGRRQEARARYPLARASGEPGQGVPYSVFPPVDNLARWWYRRALAARAGSGAADRALGMVLHAVQDASIPHHAAGCNGNWHREYERELDRFASQPRVAERLLARAERQLRDWVRRRTRPPRRLWPGDWRVLPGPAWAVEQLVTWTALQAYRAYAATHRHFRDGFKPRPESQARLLAHALAVGALVLLKAEGERSR